MDIEHLSPQIALFYFSAEPSHQRIEILMEAFLLRFLSDKVFIEYDAADDK